MIRVGIDARLGGGDAGGVEQFVIGLAQGFSKLADGDETYYFLVNPDNDIWLKPFIGGPCRLLYTKPVLSTDPSAPFSNIVNLTRFKLATKRRALIKRTRKIYARLSGHGTAALEWSNGVIERAGIELMHFTFQNAFQTTIPSIYHPHDLQHLHLPEFFSSEDIDWREMVYRHFCRSALMVAVVSSWIRNDVVRQYGEPPNKVHVIPFAPPNAGYIIPSEREVHSVSMKFCLPVDFGFYPAQTWKHKNHIALLEALAHIRHNGGPRIPFVFSGTMNDHYALIRDRIAALKLTDQVKFLGYVSPLELQSLYRLARCVVIPSKYEAASFPMWEAFEAGVPVACSNVTSLPAQAGDAALLFDPSDTKAMAHTINRLWTEPETRRQLIQRGRQRVKNYTWDKTSRIFRAHYRRLCRRNLSCEDRELLAGPAIL